MNGGLNLSVLDGWWPEGFDGTNGWAVGSGVEGDGEDADRLDAESLYRTLEEEVVPTYYERDGRGIPVRWVEMMRRALQTLAPAFNSDRMVQDYARLIYAQTPGSGFAG
jgi:starch phosphorylase